MQHDAVQNVAGAAASIAARKITRIAIKWLIGTFGWVLLIVIPVIMVAAWFAGGGRSQANDLIAQAAFPGDWLKRADQASAGTVDPGRPEQAPFRVSTEAIASLRLLRLNEQAERFDPWQLGVLLAPEFEYVTKEITTTEHYPYDVEDPEAPCVASEDRETSTISVLHKVRQYDGETTFTYRKESTTRTVAGKTITEEAWVVDKQEFRGDITRLLRAIEGLGITQPDQRVADFFTYLAASRGDPLQGNAWQGGGGWAYPSVAYNGPTDPGFPRDGWYWPAPGSQEVTDPFGWRTHPIRGTRNFHTGVDIGAPSGSPALATRAGIVTFAQYGWNGGYGNRVILTLDNGAQATYNHLSSLSVREGEAVGPAQQIGLIGSTGNSTGPHLHFELLLGGQALDPMIYLGGR